MICNKMFRVKFIFWITDRLIYKNWFLLDDFEGGRGGRGVD